ncbi:MAG TPA: hypothetical protein VEL11_17710 [Candidatus Bathyarchaeia archaeon]|nr:hypothetical protein [Candidatus Bathyarchaeia archaeon]
MKSETSIVFGALAIAALATLFALGSTRGNQQTLAVVYTHDHVLVLHHPYYGHHVLVVFLHAGHVVVHHY